MPSFNRNDKVSCENCGTQTTRVKTARDKKDIHFEQFSVLNVPTSQHVGELISTFTLQKSTAYPS